MVVSSASNQMFVPCSGDEVGDLVDERGIEDGLVVGVVERGQRDAPTALARDAPVGARFDRAVDAVAAPGRQPFDLVDGAQGRGAQFVHADEELVHRPEDDRHLGPPAMRVGVVDLALARQRVDLPEHFDDVRVGVENVLADQLGHAAFLGEAAIVVDGREDGQTVLAADEVIVVAVAGGDVDAAGAGFERDEFAEDHLAVARQEGVLILPAFEFAADEALAVLLVDGHFLRHVARGFAEVFDEGVGHHEPLVLPGVRVPVELCAVAEAGVDGDGLVGGQGPGRRGPDDDARLACQRTAGEGKFDVDRRGVLLVVFDLGLGQRGARAGGPVDGFLALVDQPALDESGERAQDFGLVGGVERQVGMVPVAEDAQAFELAALDVDELARQFLRAAADFHRRQPLVLLDDLELDGQPVAIPAGHEGRAEPGHGLGFDDEVLENLVERGAHVDIAVGEGRAVVEDKFRRVGPGRLNLPVQVGFLPMLEEQRLALDQIRLHREIGFGQVERFFVARAVAHGGRQRQKRSSVSSGDGGVKPGRAERRRDLL